MNKKKILIITLSCFVAIILLFYVNSIEYSLSDISPDNFQSKLRKTDASLFEANLQDLIPDKFPILSSYEASTSDNFNNNGLRIKNDKGSWVEVHSYRTNINYWLSFNKGRLTYASIFKQGYMDPNTPPTSLIKQMIDNLILQERFTLMRTNAKIGSDIIIKETDDSFIIGRFASYDDIQKPVESIDFSTYSKKVFPIYK